MEKQIIVKENALEIITDIEKINTLHSDYVQVETFNDYVILNFLQTYPNALPLKEGQTERPARMAKIASRVALPWEQFVNLMPVFVATIKENESKAIKNFEKAKMISEQIVSEEKHGK